MPLRKHGPLFAFLDACGQIKSPALVVGDAGSGKSAAVLLWAGRPVREVSLSDETQLEHLLGSLRPCDGTPPVAWVDGPLVSALEQQELLLLVGFDLLDDAAREALERLLNCACAGEPVALGASHSSGRSVATCSSCSVVAPMSSAGLDCTTSSARNRSSTAGSHPLVLTSRSP